MIAGLDTKIGIPHVVSCYVLKLNIGRYIFWCSTKITFLYLSPKTSPMMNKILYHDWIPGLDTRKWNQYLIPGIGYDVTPQLWRSKVLGAILDLIDRSRYLTTILDLGSYLVPGLRGHIGFSSWILRFGKMSSYPQVYNYS